MYTKSLKMRSKNLISRSPQEKNNTNQQLNPTTQEKQQ